MRRLCPIKKWERFWKRTSLWESECREIGTNKEKKRYDKMKCDCWNIGWVARRHLRSGRSKSCWCINIEKKTTHWSSYSRLYHIYSGIKHRCSNPNSVIFKYYWWRWIKNLWDNYEEFERDMWPGYYAHIEIFWEKDTTIDRINVNWDYCKENCRRATQKEQANNKRKNLNFN